MIGIFKLNLGIDFSSGTRVEILSNEPTTQEEMADYLEKIGFPADELVISGENNDTAVATYKKDFTQQETLDLKSSCDGRLRS